MMKRVVGIIAVVILAAGARQAGAQKQAADGKAQVRRHYDLGNLFYQQGKYEEAQEQYQQALDLVRDSGVKPSQKKEPRAEQKKQEPQPPGKAKPAVTEYTIGVDDALKVSVWQNPDLDQEVTVRPDGMISYPLIGDVPVLGMTIPQLTQDITDRLSEFVRVPQVSISLRKMGGSKVIVLGEINRPGIYSVTGSRTILEAIGLAGGFTRDSIPSSTLLIRGGLNKPQAKRINLSKALKGRDFSQNVVLQPEDIIFIPKKFIADVNYALSQILDPLAKGAFVHETAQNW